MSSNICRVCLCTQKPLCELSNHLADYFQEICDYAFQSGSSKHWCCDACEVALKDNFEFRNKCRSSNQILQDWEWNTSEEKCSIEALQSLLEITLKDNYLKVSKCEKSEPESTIFDEIDNSIKDEIKLELNTDDEVKRIEFEASDYEGMVIDESTHEENVVVISKKRTKSKDTVKTKKSKGVKVKKLKTKVKIARKVPGQYKLRGEIAKRSEFTQYESVFDIELFPTYADARKELQARRELEPYTTAKYRCERCYTVYKCEKLLQFHMKWHDPSPELSHECDVCSMRFSSRSTLLKHKPACHRGKFACKMCPLVTYQRQAMKSHFQKHQGKIYTCEVCNHAFKHISSYMTHKRLTHATSHVCVTCARTFVSELGLQTHRLKMHQADSTESHAGSVRCAPCGLTFHSQQVYTVHVLNTEQHKDLASDIVACPICGLSLCSAADVREHRRIHHPRPKHVRASRDPHKQKREKTSASDVIECKLCGLTGSNNFWLYQHYRTAHPSARYEAASDREFLCDQCGKGFYVSTFQCGLTGSNNFWLYQHYRTAHPSARYEAASDREFLCDQCGKGFYNKTVLKEHMYVHSGLKPFRCETCPAAFRSKQHLKLHEERHGPPSRECPHCGKKFASASNLSNHIRSHGARRYACDVCSKGFVQFSSLREHIRGVHLQLRAPRSRRSHKGALE